MVWDARTGKPLYRALVWMDMRSEGIVNDIVAADTTGLGQDMYRAKTGLPVSPYFSGTKLTWLLRNVLVCVPLRSRATLNLAQSMPGCSGNSRTALCTLQT